ncbi:MAG: hypothetical protein U0133_19460 [Gemmatimonadales bacterium]
MRFAVRRSTPVLVAVSLALLGCYAGTDPGPDSSSQPPPPAPTTVGAQVYGSIISQTLPLDGAGAWVEVRDSTCTYALAGIAGSGPAPGGTPGSSYYASLTTQRVPFPACVLVHVSYVLGGMPGATESTTQVQVRFTAAGATGGQLYRRDIVVP